VGVAGSLRRCLRRFDVMVIADANLHCKHKFRIYLHFSCKLLFFLRNLLLFLLLLQQIPRHIALISGNSSRVRLGLWLLRDLQAQMQKKDRSADKAQRRCNSLAVAVTWAETRANPCMNGYGI
jgi:hypothetical protein